MVCIPTHFVRGLTERKIRARYSYLCDTYSSCITGTCARIYNPQSKTSGRLHGSSIYTEIDSDVVWVVAKASISVLAIAIDLIYGKGIGIDLVFCGGRKRVGVQSASQYTWVLSRGFPKFTCFQSGDRNWIDISVGAEITLDFLWGIEIHLVLMLTSKFDLFFVWG